MQQKTLVRYTAVFVTLWCVSSTALAQNGERAPLKTPRITIENFGRINDGYFRGAQPKFGDYPALASLGVKTVINLTSDDADPNEERFVVQNGMAYLQIPMNTRVHPTKQQLETFLRAVNDPGQQPVFVHCVGGKHRTGVMTAVYRMTNDKWTADQAFREMKRFKFGMDFLHPEFKAFVYGYRPDAAPILATQQIIVPATN